MATATACLVNVCLRLRGMFLVGGGVGVVPPPAPQTSMTSSCGEMRIAVGASGKWHGDADAALTFHLSARTLDTTD